MDNNVMTFNIPNIFRGNKDEVISQFWNAKPSPYLCIDNFLELEHFHDLAKEVDKISIKPTLTFETDIQKGKAIFSNENSPKLVQNVIDILTDPSFITQLSELIGIDSLKPLTEFKTEHMPFNYFHRMSDGGFLGSHVDHSSQSFHGVSKLKGNSLERSTIYMDYNTNKTNLSYLNAQSKRSGSKFVAKYWRH